MLPEIVRYAPALWPRLAAERVQAELEHFINGKRRGSIMLTGGSSAERLYSEWAALPAFQGIENVDFYFGDERCVPVKSVESNYGLAMRTLFRTGVPSGCSVWSMAPGNLDPVVAAQRYDAALPDVIDLLLLGVGSDGHIASLFPGSPAMSEKTSRIVAVTGPKPPVLRITVTPPVIAAARRVFVLAPGARKARVLVNALADRGGRTALPAHLALKGTWLIDTPIPEGLPA